MNMKEEGAKHEKTESKPFEKKEDKGLKDALGAKRKMPFKGPIKSTETA